MGASMMQVQPSTQPAGKGGALPPASVMRGDTVSNRAIPSQFTGQPNFGRPNKYAQNMPQRLDSPMNSFGGGVNQIPSGKGGAQGKGQSSSNYFNSQPFVAPTQFPVANQFNTQPTPIDQEEQKPQALTYGGSEGYGAGGM